MPPYEGNGRDPEDEITAAGEVAPVDRELVKPTGAVRARIDEVYIPTYPTREIKGGSDGTDGYNF